FPVPHMAGDADHLGTGGGTDLLRHIPARIGLATGHDDFRALLREFPRDGLAYPPAPPGDDRYAPGHTGSVVRHQSLFPVVASRISTRLILPVSVFGSSSTISMIRGTA